MKSSKRVGDWRPLMGVAVVSAMALGVSALAGPRVADDAARGTSKGGTDVTRLVTGAPAQINEVVAGAGASAVLAMNPINPPGGLPGYPAGVSIVGNELRIDRAANKDGFRAWFHGQVSDWDPGVNGPNLAAVQIKIEASGYYHSDCLDLNPDTGSDGLDLIPTVQACVTNADCRPPVATGFGEGWVKCIGGFCENGYIDAGGTGVMTVEAESWCEPTDGACTGSGVAVGTPNYLYFLVSDSVTGRPDNNELYYVGTLVLDLPAGAKGKYVVTLNAEETFVASPGAPPIVLESLSETGFVVNFVTGSCCYKLGTELAGCEDDCINRSDCAALGAPFVFTPGAVCANEPTDDGCVECVIDGADPLCDDGDSCTTETCNAAIGVCNRGFVGGWDTATECCDGSGPNPVIALINDGNPCTDDACSAGPIPATQYSANGVPTHTPASASTACDDNNPCSVSDHCAGPPSVSCVGTDVNSLPCTTSADCPLDPAGSNYACVEGSCFCTLTPTVTFEIPVGELKTCFGGPRNGLSCTRDADCAPLGVCDNYANGANCFDEGEKVPVLLHIGASGAPVNGGQFLIQYDSSCVSLKSVTCLAPYTTTVYGPILNPGSIFIACGVDAFAGNDGPFGGVDMLALQFNKIGQCNNCELRVASNNPQNSYLVDGDGQRIAIEPVAKELGANGDLELNTPDNIKVNADCDGPTAVVLWNAPGADDLPNASFSCGDANLVCRGAHTSGYSYPAEVVDNGGEMLSGESTFCCYAWAKHKCDQVIGCPGPVNQCTATGLKDNGNMGREGCWTVEVSDQTTLDIDVQLCPPIASSEMERCIKFCLFANCAQDPICFEDNVTFGGLFNFIGKSRGTVKVPGNKQWGCITAQDQLHTLRSCYTFGANDCDGGTLHAEFSGDHAYGGDCLIGGNLDGWKKNVPGSSPSLDVIDILDYGTFVSQYGVNYGSANTPCPAIDHGPNADINGDGKVDMADYQYILNNFLTSAKDCCCGPQAADLPPALTEVSVDELREMGLSDLAVADLNGDGVLNADDMDAFMQGARPVKSSDRKGGKGLRSGR